MDNGNRTRRLENAHVALWLLKDYSWCTSVKWLGLVMAVPTIVLAVMLARESWKRVEDFLHNAAVCYWIAANITWMLGEFYFQDGTRRYAQIFFYAGLMCVAIYYAWMAGAWLRAWWQARLQRSWAAAVIEMDQIDEAIRAGRLTRMEAQDKFDRLRDRLRAHARAQSKRSR